MENENIGQYLEGFDKIKENVDRSIALLTALRKKKKEQSEFGSRFMEIEDIIGAVLDTQAKIAHQLVAINNTFAN
jgi:hypothetical protein